MKNEQMMLLYEKEFKKEVLNLLVKVLAYIQENSEKLMKKPNLEKVLLDSFVTIKLDTNESYSLIYDRMGSGEISLTLVNCDDKIIFTVIVNPHSIHSKDKIDIDLMSNLSYNGYDSDKMNIFRNIASDICDNKIQFSDCNVIGDNASKENIEQFCKKFLGIENPSYITRDYKFISPYEVEFRAVSGKFDIAYHDCIGDYKEINYCDETTRIEQKYRYYNNMEQVLVRQTITMAHDGYTIQLITSHYGFEINYINDEYNFKRSIKLSLGSKSDGYQWKNALKKFSVCDNGKYVLYVLGANSYYKESLHKWIRVYEVYENDDDNNCLILGEDDAKSITQHRKISDFMLSVVNLIKEYYPHLIEETFEYKGCGGVLEKAIHGEYEDNARTNSIIDETIDNGDAIRYDSNGTCRLLTKNSYGKH